MTRTTTKLALALALLLVYCYGIIIDDAPHTSLSLSFLYLIWAIKISSHQECRYILQKNITAFFWRFFHQQCDFCFPSLSSWNLLSSSLASRSREIFDFFLFHISRRSFEFWKISSRVEISFWIRWIMISKWRFFREEEEKNEWEIRNAKRRRREGEDERKSREKLRATAAARAWAPP